MSKPFLDESSLEKNVCDYGSSSYWDMFHSETSSLRPQGSLSDNEWFVNYVAIKPLIEENTSKENKNDCKVLHVGCGLSSIANCLALDGYDNIENIDFSPVAIKKMKELHPDHSWRVMDCTRLNFDDNAFDCAIDKAVLDSICCSSRKRTWDYCHEVFRVLKEGGKWIIVSQAPPNERLEFFFNKDNEFGPIIAFDYTVTLTYDHLNEKSRLQEEDTVDGYFYVYVCTKNTHKLK